NPGISPVGVVDVPATAGFADDVDTLQLRPYADNSPQGWGIHVNFNEGVPGAADVLPDGDAADLLIYETSQAGGPVSEAIVVQPSAVDAGQLVVTDAANGTPIVTISYLANTDLRILDNDGFASDTDTLTLRGTHADTPS